MSDYSGGEMTTDHMARHYSLIDEYRSAFDTEWPINVAKLDYLREQLIGEIEGLLYPSPSCGEEDCKSIRSKTSASLKEICRRLTKIIKQNSFTSSFTITGRPVSVHWHEVVKNITVRGVQGEGWYEGFKSVVPANVYDRVGEESFISYSMLDELIEQGLLSPGSVEIDGDPFSGVGQIKRISLPSLDLDLLKSIKAYLEKRGVRFEAFPGGIYKAYEITAKKR